MVTRSALHEREGISLWQSLPTPPGAAFLLSMGSSKQRLFQTQDLQVISLKQGAFLVNCNLGCSPLLRIFIVLTSFTQNGENLSKCMD